MPLFADRVEETLDIIRQGHLWMDRYQVEPNNGGDE